MSKRTFLVLPGAEITMGFDFTGQVLEQYGEDWLESPHVPGSYVLKQPEKDANGKECARGGCVTIDRKYLMDCIVQNLASREVQQPPSSVPATYEELWDKLQTTEARLAQVEKELTRANQRGDRWKRDAERMYDIAREHRPTHIHVLNHFDLVRSEKRNDEPASITIR